MTSTIITSGSNAAIEIILTSAIRALCVAGIAAVGLTAFRVKAPPARLFVWRSVLVAALAMPLLGTLLPPTLISTPPFLRTLTTQPAKNQLEQPGPIAVPNDVALSNRGQLRHSRLMVSGMPAQVHGAERASNSRLHALWLATGWNAVAAVIYSIVASILLLRFVVGIFLSRRLVRASPAIGEERLRTAMASHARALQRIPPVLESALISVPVTVGARRPAILLPLSWREWDDATLDAVIAHETSHIARRDALAQYVSLLHRAIFWFSPLAWWLDHHLAALAEEASDEAALAHGADRNHYARTLLGFFAALQSAPGRVWWQGVSMANGGHAEQRLERILAWKGSIRMNLRKPLLVAIVISAIPIVYLVASVRPSGYVYASGAGQSTPAPATASQVQAPAPPPAVAAVPAPPAHGISVSGPAPVGVVAPALAGVPAVPAPPASYAYGYDDEERFVIVSGKSDSYTMSGSTGDIHHIEKLKKQIAGDFIWFQRDEKSYIIRDQATIDRAKAFWFPQEELGKKQEALGKQQEALGKQQEELGNKMEQVRVNVPDMTAALDALKAKLQKLGPTATMEQIGDLQSEIGELQSKMGEIQSQAGEQQGKLGEEQGKLGEKQGKLGEQQGELGRQQEKLAREAAIKMKVLLDEALKNGKAQPESSDGSSGASL